MALLKVKNDNNSISTFKSDDLRDPEIALTKANVKTAPFIDLPDSLWKGLTSFYGSYIWTDGVNIYYSQSSTQKVLDRATSTWNNKSWTGLSSFNASNVWTDGDDIYYSNGSDQYVLDKDTSTWSAKTWTGLTSFSGNKVWTDGDNVYYSDSTDQYVLVKP
jgi:hypothetical protein